MTERQRKVLIVSPRFPPVNSADQHRVRTSLPFYREFGWVPTVLALTPESSDGVRDPDLEKTLPPDVRVIRAKAIPEQVTRLFGFGHVDLRCLPALYRAGTRLLRKERFDLVYFSTTVFNSYVLGRLWKRRFGCRIVFDFQDPWFEENTGIYNRGNAPGGWLKYSLSQRISRRLERFAMRAADSVVSVSPAYSAMLCQRYEWLTPEMFTVIPFGAALNDFEVADAMESRQSAFSGSDGLRHVVYVGRGGPDMLPALTALFSQLALTREEHPELMEGLRFHFVGTNYSPTNRTFKVVEPEAIRWGVGDIVFEEPTRVPFFEAIALMRDSDALLLVGSSQSGYTPSKFLTYVQARKPILALLHRESVAFGLAKRVPWVRLVPLRSGIPSPDGALEMEAGLLWLTSVGEVSEEEESPLSDYSAQALTKAQCEVLDRAMGPRS